MRTRKTRRRVLPIVAALALIAGSGALVTGSARADLMDLPWEDLTWSEGTDSGGAGMNDVVTGGGDQEQPADLFGDDASTGQNGLYDSDAGDPGQSETGAYDLNWPTNSEQGDTESGDMGSGESGSLGSGPADPGQADSESLDPESASPESADPESADLGGQQPVPPKPSPRPTPLRPPPPPDPATANKEFHDAVNTAFDRLKRYPKCNKFVTGLDSPDGKTALEVLETLWRAPRLFDVYSKHGTPAPDGRLPYAEATYGKGAAGTIYLYQEWHQSEPLPVMYNNDDGGKPLDPNEWRTLILLHELAHLTKAMSSHKTAAGDTKNTYLMNEGIVLTCLRGKGK
ncbi:hypothetical protein ACTWPT_19680 [Nonomuraea sp. 3N208]|uniref:hypothetical protein n=1 Tax=Nonomuraea sp. 3N208 TaxID=3457421 RepID=UPI003FCE44B8